MTHEMKHCDRPWWKRPPVWFIAIAAMLLLSWVVIEQTDKRPTLPYGIFLDQLEADNVTSVTFQGTEISGRFKHPLESAPSAWTSVLARIPWPMLVFLGVVLVAALVRLVRGGKAPSGSAAPTLPAHGVMGLVSGLFAKQPPSESPPTHDSDEPKSR